jgi:hypothetical protein
MNVSLDKVCDYLRKWGDLSLGDLREVVAKRMGDRPSVYRKHSRGELLALLMADDSNWKTRAPVCTR